MENSMYPYKRILYELECSILSGRSAPGECIPSVRALAAQYRVNPNTVQRALKELEQKEKNQKMKSIEGIFLQDVF